jgi:hypothetical protein
MASPGAAHVDGKPLRPCQLPIGPIGAIGQLPVTLSITHNFCSDSGAQRDVGQPR